MKIAICPGSFDPITNGHLDIINRTSKLFDKVIVVVLSNYAKSASTFTAVERVEMINKCIADMPNVVADLYDGLLADYARTHNGTAIVKGLRAVSDFEYEFQQALTNKQLNNEVETIFITSSAENMFLSSSVVRQVCKFGGDISKFVPPVIHDEIIKRIQSKNQ